MSVCTVNMHTSAHIYKVDIESHPPVVAHLFIAAESMKPRTFNLENLGGKLALGNLVSALQCWN